MSEQAEEVIEQEQPAAEAEVEQAEAESSWEESQESESEANDTEAEAAEEGEQEEEEVELFLGDKKLESPTSENEAKDTDLVKKLRKEIQDRNKELSELRSKQNVAPAVSLDEILVMPTFEDSGYDDNVHAENLAKYSEKKIAQDKARADRDVQQAEFMKLHNQKLAAYKESASKLKVKGFAEAEKAVLEEVPESIQGAILHYADKPEIVVLAAGLNPAIRKQLSETTDPVALGKLIGSIEAKVKLMPKSKIGKPAPSAPVRGTQGAGKQSKEDVAFNTAFPDAVIQ